MNDRPRGEVNGILKAAGRRAFPAMMVVFVLVAAALPGCSNSAVDETPRVGTDVPAPTGTGEPAASETDEVSFADQNLEAAVRKAINVPSGPIRQPDLKYLMRLDATSCSITSLDGIQQCTSLVVLGLDRNALTLITPLSGMSWLQQLHLRGNRVVDTSPACRTAVVGLPLALREQPRSNSPP
jgi:Leucine-rich repeat (LRR) protein